MRTIIKILFLSIISIITSISFSWVCLELAKLIFNSLNPLYPSFLENLITAAADVPLFSPKTCAEYPITSRVCSNMYLAITFSVDV